MIAIKVLSLTTVVCVGIIFPRLNHPPLIKGDQGGSVSRENLECPSDVETLTPLLLRDLPNYANRVLQRARSIQNTPDLQRFILFAGRAEYEPLDLGPTQQLPTAKTPSDPPKQIFFTTLERQYVNQKPLEIQNYHWLFLTQSADGWRLAMALTRFGTMDKTQPPSPPRDTSDGVIGQAVNLWLRDCRAGSIRKQ